MSYEHYWYHGTRNGTSHFEALLEVFSHSEDPKDPVSADRTCVNARAAKIAHLN